MDTSLPLPAVVCPLVGVDTAVIGQPDRRSLPHSESAPATDGEDQVAPGSTGCRGRMLCSRHVRIRAGQLRDSDCASVNALQYLIQQPSVRDAAVCDNGDPARAEQFQFGRELCEAAQAADYLRAD